MGLSDVPTSDDDATTVVEGLSQPVAATPGVRPGVVFVNGYDAGRVVILEEAQTLLGRGDGCHVQIHERGVSRRHLVLDMAADGVQVIDLRSRNGVYVNGERVERHWLKDQDVIRIGREVTLRFSLLSSDELAFLDKMYHAAVLDPLTRVYNRRYFMGLLGRHLENGAPGPRGAALLLVDLDRFKHLNDTYGHQTGDVALRHAATLMRAGLRDRDTMGRFGGEEFTVLLNDVDAGGASQIAERTRAAVEASPLIHEGSAITMTVSIGVAMADEADGDPDRLFALADARLYEAKRAGRNRVCCGPAGGPALAAGTAR